MLHRLPRFLGVLSVIAVQSLLAGCGGDSGITGPNDDSGFPCVRGNMSASSVVSGSLGTNDCLTDDSVDVFDVPVGSGPGSYFETWLLRVSSSGEYTITASSDFDSFLDIYEVSDTSNPSSAAWITADDDSVGLDARLQVFLTAGTDYWVTMSGYESTDRGAYTLTVAP